MSNTWSCTCNQPYSSDRATVARQCGPSVSRGRNFNVVFLLRRYTLDVDACHPHESGCPPQLLQVAIELVLQYEQAFQPSSFISAMLTGTFDF